MVLPSDETKFRTGVALCLEDPFISTFLPVEEYPIHFIRLGKPIQRNKGYVIYEFASNLFSRYCTPQPEKPPTNLIVILEFHAHSEAAHLISQEATFHQQVLEDEYALPPLCTLDNKWPSLWFEIMSSKWHEEVEKMCEAGQSEQEGEGYLMM
jgi:hypothetical protein